MHKNPFYKIIFDLIQNESEIHTYWNQEIKMQLFASIRIWLDEGDRDRDLYKINIYNESVSNADECLPRCTHRLWMHTHFSRSLASKSVWNTILTKRRRNNNNNDNNNHHRNIKGPITERILDCCSALQPSMHSAPICVRIHFDLVFLHSALVFCSSLISQIQCVLHSLLSIARESVCCFFALLRCRCIRYEWRKNEARKR